MTYIGLAGCWVGMSVLPNRLAFQQNVQTTVLHSLLPLNPVFSIQIPEKEAVRCRYFL